MFSKQLYPNEFYIGFNCFGTSIHVPFKEGVNVSGSSVMGGVNVGYEYLKPSFFYSGIDLAFSTGDSSLEFNYGTHPVIPANCEGDFLYGEFRLGYPFVKNQWILTPCAGIGLYYFPSLKDSSVSLDTPFVSVGLRMLYQKSDLFDYGCNISIYGEFLKQFRGKIDGEVFHISTGSDMGGRISFPLVWHVGKTRRWDARLEPFLVALSFWDRELLYGATCMIGYHF